MTTDTRRIWEYQLQDGRGHAIAQIVPNIGAGFDAHTAIVFYEADGNPAEGHVECYTAEGAAAWLAENGYLPA
jgi:hypothetical protein